MYMHMCSVHTCDGCVNNDRSTNGDARMASMMIRINDTGTHTLVLPVDALRTSDGTVTATGGATATGDDDAADDDEEEEEDERFESSSPAAGDLGNSDTC